MGSEGNGLNRELWPHQVEGLTALRQTLAAGVKRIVLSAPTGSGKTLMSAAIVDGAQRKGNRLAFVVSSISLIDQTLEAFYAEGIRNMGVIQASHEMTDWSKPVQICSIQTLRARGAYPEAKIVIFDECHQLHDFHKKWLLDPEWLSVPFIGLSATPGTKGLGKYFETLITISTTQELIEKGHLSPFRVFATGHPNLTEVRTVAGDYHEGELSKAMQEGSLTADIVQTWKAKWGKDKTLCYGVDCAHAEMIRDRFIEAGVTCGYQDARTPGDERREIKRKFHNGDYQIVANVGTLTTGVDWDVRCLILARPTRSAMLYQQIIGRALRTADDKTEAIILDHSDTTKRLGFVTDIFWDELSTGTAAEKEKKKLEPPLPKECPQCTAMLPRGLKVCPNCGHEFKVVSGLIERNGELVEVSAGERPKKGAKRIYTMAEKQVFFSGLLFMASGRGYKPGWAANQYKSKFGVWPNSLSSAMCEPSLDVKMWVKSRQIAFAMSKRREARVHES